MHRISTYYAQALSLAIHSTWKSWPIRKLGLDVSLFVPGLIFYYFWKGWPAAMDEWAVFIAFGLAPITVLGSASVAWYVLLAPVKIDSAHRVRISELEQKLSALTELMNSKPAEDPCVVGARTILNDIASGIVTAAYALPKGEDFDPIMSESLGRVGGVLSSTLMGELDAELRTMHGVVRTGRTRTESVYIGAGCATHVEVARHIAGWITKVSSTLVRDSLNPSYLFSSDSIKDG